MNTSLRFVKKPANMKLITLSSITHTKWTLHYAVLNSSMKFELNFIHQTVWVRQNFQPTSSGLNLLISKIYYTERLCSAGILPRVSSIASLDPPSDESLASLGGLHMRSNSIPSGNGDRKKTPRRLSVKHDQLSVDSMC